MFVVRDVFIAVAGLRSGIAAMFIASAVLFAFLVSETCKVLSEFLS